MLPILKAFGMVLLFAFLIGVIISVIWFVGEMISLFTFG